MGVLEGTAPRIALGATHDLYPAEMIDRSVNEIVIASTLFFLGTVRGGVPYACVMVVAYDADLCLLFFSDPKTEHVSNILQDRRVAGEIADTRQTWESPRRGIQFRGTARPVTGDEYSRAVDLYMTRYPGFERHRIVPTSNKPDAVKVRPYIVRPSYLKIFDEKIFGRETWVEVKLPEHCNEFPGPASAS